MKLFGVYSAVFSVLVAVFLCSSTTFAIGKDNQRPSKSGQVSSQGQSAGKSSSTSSSRGLPSLDGLVHGLGLGLRKRRSLYNKVTNQQKKPTGKDYKCNCPIQNEEQPVCASDGKTYKNKCMFQCEVMKTKKQSNSKNSKKFAKVPTLKIVNKGKCSPATDTTTYSPVVVAHQTVTEVSNIVNGQLSKHLPLDDH